MLKNVKIELQKISMFFKNFYKFDFIFRNYFQRFKLDLLNLIFSKKWVLNQNN